MPPGYPPRHELIEQIKAYQAERGSPANTCGSWPNCKAAPRDNSVAFCDTHQKVLDGASGRKVKGEVFNPQEASHKAAPEPAPAPEPAREPAPVKQARTRNARAKASAEILGALAEGPLSPDGISAAVSTTQRTRARALMELVEAGKVTRSGGEGRARDARYALAGGARGRYPGESDAEHRARLALYEAQGGDQVSNVGDAKRANG